MEAAKKQIKQILPDFTLLLDRIENEIISGSCSDQTKSMLENKNLWEQTSPEILLKWASLSQMAGNIDNALDILKYINIKQPELKQAWFDRMELLYLLDRKKDLASVALLAKKHTNSGSLNNQYYTPPDAKQSQKEITKETIPFENLQYRAKLLSCFISLFSGREDVFARQWAEKKQNKNGYVPVKRAMEFSDVESHIKGYKTFGIYLLKSDSTVKTAVIDADVIPEFRKKLSSKDAEKVRRETAWLIQRIKEISMQYKAKPLVEVSGHKGLHFWYFFEQPVDAGQAKFFLNSVIKNIEKDLSIFSLEVFTKQDKLSGKGLGNLVKLPLGIHRLTGKRSIFPECKAKEIDSQLEFLNKVELIPQKNLKNNVQVNNIQEINLHPGFNQKMPELLKLRQLCPPLGQIISLCSSGRNLSQREEKVLYQTIGFLDKGKTLIHYLVKNESEYNPHMVDYKLSRLRGTPLGCKRIHSLMDYTGDYCPFDLKDSYAHPLLHLGNKPITDNIKSERITNLSGAVENLKQAISILERFLK